MALLIFYVSLALGVSFLCSVMEAVLLSVTPSFVARTEKNNPRLGARLRKLKARRRRSSAISSWASSRRS